MCAIRSSKIGLLLLVFLLLTETDQVDGSAVTHREMHMPMPTRPIPHTLQLRCIDKQGTNRPTYVA